jgi:hypothetical protein
VVVPLDVRQSYLSDAHRHHEELNIVACDSENNSAIDANEEKNLSVVVPS